MTKNETQPNPFDLFYTWYDLAKKSKDENLDAMAMATASKNGFPSVRVVLYKGIQQGGFLIYINRGMVQRSIEARSCFARSSSILSSTSSLSQFS